MDSTDRAVSEFLNRVTPLTPEGTHRSTRNALERALVGLDEYVGNPAWTDGCDVLGSAFEEAIDGSDRRRLGQFFTPIQIGRVMARWVLDAKPKLVLDPGCGSGSLLIAAMHERATTTKLLGVDVDRLTAEMCRWNARLRSAPNVEVRVSDFLCADLNDQPDGVICNPPYTRHHALSATKKNAIYKGFSRRLGVDFHRTSSLHVLFLVRALEVSAPTARLAFITPSHWLDKKYGDLVKKYLLEVADIDSIITVPAQDLVFDGAITTAAITFIQKGMPTSRGTRMLFSDSASGADVQTAVDGTVKLTKLTAVDKWSNRASRTARSGVSLGELAEVHRGIATGCNDFFVLSEKRRRELRIALCSVRSCVPKPRIWQGSELTEESLTDLPTTVRRWLFAPSRIRSEGPVADYLRAGVTEYKVLSRTLVRQRDTETRNWWQIQTEVDAPILVTYINQGDARFVRNRVNAIPLNNWLMISPKVGVNVEDLFRALSAPGFSERLRERGREYGQGMWKLEPSELREVRVAMRDAH